jgi:hypothetical protein
MVRRRSALVAGALVALALGLAACSSGPSAAPTTARPDRNVARTTTTTLPALVAALTRRMLVATDLPGGWVLRSTASVPTPAGLPPASCIPVLQGLAARGGLSAYFVSSDGKEQLSEQAGAYPSAGAAGAAYTNAVRALASCPVVLPALSKVRPTGVLAPLTVPPVGQGSAGYALTVAGGRGPAERSGLVVAHTGSRVVVLELTPAVSPASVTTLGQIARAAVAKLAR